MTNDWAAKAVDKVQLFSKGAHPMALVVYRLDAMALIRQAQMRGRVEGQAQERARWREAIKKRMMPGDTGYGIVYNQALADLAQAMKGQRT